jgi:serine/threonine protein kinase
MNEHVTGLDEVGLDLLIGMTALDPNKRISARMALLHPYFDSLDKSKLPF